MIGPIGETSGDTIKPDLTQGATYGPEFVQLGARGDMGVKALSDKVLGQPRIHDVAPRQPSTFPAVGHPVVRAMYEEPRGI